MGIRQKGDAWELRNNKLTRVPAVSCGPNGCSFLLQGFGDAQLRRLTAVLLQRRIWSLNVGENFQVSLGAWQEFAVRRPAVLEGHA